MQLWQCKLCRRVFTPAPAELRYKTYPLRIILDGVTLYNLGYSLPEAAAKLKSRHGYKVSPSTLASWMSEHRELTTYSRLRPQTAAPISANQNNPSVETVSPPSLQLRLSSPEACAPARKPAARALRSARRFP